MELIHKTWFLSSSSSSYYRRRIQQNHHGFIVIPFKFDHIHGAHRDLMEDGEKDHPEVFMACFMAQILAHNRCCSTLVYGIRRTPDLFNKFKEEKEPSPLHGALHQHHDESIPQAKIEVVHKVMQKLP